MTMLFWFLAVLFQVGAAARCREGWSYYEGTNFCYAFFDIWKNYDDAIIYCRQQGGTLATPHTPEALQFVSSLRTADIWLGLTDQWIEGTFIWQDGQELPSDYDGWVSGRPKDSTADNCVLLFSGSLLFYDGYCSNSNKFVCQVPSIPDPCDDVKCDNGGVCNSETGAAVCNCPTGYAGERCEEKTITYVKDCDAERLCPQGLECIEVYLSSSRRSSCIDLETDIPSSICLPKKCTDCNMKGVCTNKGTRVNCIG